jgi:hypothetical protein
MWLIFLNRRLNASREREDEDASKELERAFKKRKLATP